jgi:hypothetical protein
MNPQIAVELILAAGAALLLTRDSHCRIAASPDPGVQTM